MAALADFNEAIRVAPDDFHAYNSRAWLFGTCPDTAFRNGPKAVQDARRACELTAWKSAEVLGTLAAAYAEQGDFDLAVKWQNRALGLTAEAEKPEQLRLLELYRAGRPHRDSPSIEITQQD